MALLDSESDDNWHWFMQYLKAIVIGDKIYTFVFDRYSRLLKSISTIFSYSYHSYCYWHLKFNLTAVISSNDRRRLFIFKKLKKLVYALTHKEFQTEYENFVKFKSQQAKKFLASMPFEYCAMLTSLDKDMIVYPL